VLGCQSLLVSSDLLGLELLTERISMFSTTRGIGRENLRISHSFGPSKCRNPISIMCIPDKPDVKMTTTLNAFGKWGC
jgi:hypothetical protein